MRVFITQGEGIRNAVAAAPAVENLIVTASGTLHTQCFGSTPCNGTDHGFRQGDAIPVRGYDLPFKIGSICANSHKVVGRLAKRYPVPHEVRRLAKQCADEIGI